LQFGFCLQLDELNSYFKQALASDDNSSREAVGLFPHNRPASANFHAQLKKTGHLT
jgi:hypothetical protein